MCWHGETARCSGTFSAGATLTLYNVQYRGLLGGVHVLQILTSTKIVERPVLRETSFQAFKEVCAGIGGISVGFERLGGRCLAAVDHNPLACAALRQQPLQVIQGDIADPEVRRQVHLVQPELRCMLAAGIPWTRSEARLPRPTQPHPLPCLAVGLAFTCLRNHIGVCDGDSAASGRPCLSSGLC